MDAKELPVSLKGLPLSPRGRGMRSLSEQSELRRSWVRGRAGGAQRVSAVHAQFGQPILALLRARAPIGALPLIQLRLSSLALAKAPHPSPARGEGKDRICERAA